MKSKRPVRILALSGVFVFLLASCNYDDENVPNPEQITAKIVFAKDVLGESLYTQDEKKVSEDIPINTNVYVLVTFKFNNLDKVDDIVEFEIRLTPGIDTYETYDYSAGPISPTKIGEGTIREGDEIKKIIEIKGMDFQIDSEREKTNDFKYVFIIKAIVASENCKFTARFSPQNGRFNKGNKHPVDKIHNFVDVE